MTKSTLMQLGNALVNYSNPSNMYSIYLLKLGCSPVHKAGDNSDLTNYRPIPVLPYFSKFLERIMYNSPFSYVSQEKSYILNNSVFNLVIQQSVLFCNQQTKFMNLLKIICILQVFLQIYQKPLIQSTIPQFLKKNRNIWHTWKKSSMV